MKDTWIFLLQLFFKKNGSCLKLSIKESSITERKPLNQEVGKTEVSKVMPSVNIQSQTQQKNVYRKATINSVGYAIIPDGTEVIGRRVFCQNKRLTKAVIPGTVRIICEGAFICCENLRYLELNEGLDTIESNVFTGCSSLKKLTIPDSVTDLCSWAFHDFTGLREPIYNRSSNILYHFPNSANQAEFVVPEAVTRIHGGAFLRHPTLEEVTLPEGLKQIDGRAFFMCKMKTLTIPATVENVCRSAFQECKNLEKVTILCGLSAFAFGAFSGCGNVVFYTAEGKVSYAESLRLCGVDFLEVPRGLKVPDSNHCKTKSFQKLANQSCQGNANAMLKLATFFEHLGDQPFFMYASNYWRYLAARYGNDEAQCWVQEWQRNHPQQRMPAALPSNHNFYISGDYLRSLGYLSFDPQRGYAVGELGADGIVEVSSWCDEDGPDEDGYGREEYYDWWYLDALLQPIPGISMIHSYSNLDKRNNEKKFTQLRKDAAQTLKQSR